MTEQFDLLRKSYWVVLWQYCMFDTPAELIHVSTKDSPSSNRHKFITGNGSQEVRLHQ